MKKRIFAVLAVFGLLLASLNIGGLNQAIATESNEDIVIGASLLTQAHPFQVAVSDAIEAEAENLGVTVEISIADQDLNRQIASIEDFITREVDAIILIPVDSDGVTGAINRAIEAGIPVVTVDIKANGVEVESHVATDNYTGGMIAAEAMAKYIDGEGEVGLITYPEVQSVRDRIDGFKAHAEQYEEMEIVTELPGRTRQEAKTASEDMLTAYPDLKGIFGFGDDMAIAATSAIAERETNTIVIGFDGLEEAQNSVSEDNAFKAVVVQFPEEMGSVAVQNAVNLVRGEEVAQETPITPGLFIEGEGLVEVTVEDNIVTIHD